MPQSDLTDKQSSDRQLLRYAHDLQIKNWTTPERKFFAADLSKQLTLAIHQDDKVAMIKLRTEIEWFNSPVFVLGERIGVLINRHGSRGWRNDKDVETWQLLIDRAKLAYKKRDPVDLKELGKKLASFLRRQNEHKLAQALEDAVKN